MINETSKALHKNVSIAELKINSIIEKNKYLSKILDDKNESENTKIKRKNLINKNNISNETILNESDYLKHYNNYYTKIDDENYIHSCGNYFINNEVNQTKLINCDGHGSNYLKEFDSCLIPNTDSYIKKIDNKFPLFKNIDECLISNNKDSVLCNKKYFTFGEGNYLEFDRKETC